MTREEAIQELQNCKGLIQQDGQDYLDDRDIPLLDMAIEALSEPNMIPIKLEKRYPHSRDEDITDAFMRGYQSAQAELVRCKDCRYWKNFNNAQGICHERPNIITTEQYNDFCSHGERREE